MVENKKELEWLASNIESLPEMVTHLGIDNDGEVRFFGDGIYHDFYPKPLPPESARKNGLCWLENMVTAGEFYTAKRKVVTDE